jgi:hypothetical protein
MFIIIRKLTFEKVNQSSRGRPKLTWDESVNRDLKEWNISKDLGLDRSDWRLAINVPEPWPLPVVCLLCSFVCLPVYGLFWVVYPNLLGTKGYVVIVKSQPERNKKLLLQHQHILIYNSIAKSQLFQSILLPNPQLLLATLVSRRGRARITTYRKGPRLSLQPPQVWTRPWRPGGGGCWLPVMTFSLLPLVSSTMMVTTPFSSPSYCTFKPVWSTML